MRGELLDYLSFFYVFDDKYIKSNTQTTLRVVVGNTASLITSPECCIKYIPYFCSYILFGVCNAVLGDPRISSIVDALHCY